MMFTESTVFTAMAQSDVPTLASFVCNGMEYGYGQCQAPTTQTCSSDRIVGVKCTEGEHVSM